MTWLDTPAPDDGAAGQVNVIKRIKLILQANPANEPLATPLTARAQFSRFRIEGWITDENIARPAIPDKEEFNPDSPREKITLALHIRGNLPNSALIRAFSDRQPTHQPGRQQQYFRVRPRQQIMITQLFSEAARRDPYPLYDQIRSSSPLLHDPQSGLWILFDYESVNRALTDHETFSSRNGPVEWMIFLDPPRHTKLRGLISQAFTPRSVSNLEPRIRELCRHFLDRADSSGEFDLASHFAVPLPMAVIAEMLGIPMSDRSRFTRWNDAILAMSYTVAGAPASPQIANAFRAVTAEMNDYLAILLEERRSKPKDDLLTRLLHAELDGERLAPPEILGFFQLLLLAGSETTTNLINNAVLSFIEYPDQLALLRAQPALLPQAIEEVLRFRSPLQWMFRVTTREVTLHDQKIPAGKVVLAMIGSANRDPKVFIEPNRFNIQRHPNPHLAFGHGIHFCLGAALARLESRVALTEFLARFADFKRASDEPWRPREGLHVHGPTHLPLLLQPALAAPVA